jgi:hypothetical protein
VEWDEVAGDRELSGARFRIVGWVGFWSIDWIN